MTLQSRYEHATAAVGDFAAATDAAPGARIVNRGARRTVAIADDGRVSGALRDPRQDHRRRRPLERDEFEESEHTCIFFYNNTSTLLAAGSRLRVPVRASRRPAARRHAAGGAQACACF